MKFNKYKKLSLIAAALLIALGLTACGDSNKDSGDANTENTEVEEPLDITELTVEEETAREFEENESVERAIVQLETIGDQQFVYAHISLAETSDEDIDAMATSYKETLEEKYPDRKIDLIISRGDDILFGNSEE